MNTAFEVLVAEDSADDVLLLREAFKKAKATSRLRAISDGLEVLAYLRGEGVYRDRTAHPYPDLLLLDLKMPRLNGLEVLERVRQELNRSPLVIHVLTASCREEDVRRAYELGANGFVTKPSRVDELVEFVKALHDWHRFMVLPPRLEEQQPAHF